jgi:hypothetical protein
MAGSVVGLCMQHFLAHNHGRLLRGYKTENEEAVTMVQKFAVDRVKRDG